MAISPDIREQAKELLETVERTSHGAAQGGQDEAMDLIYALVPERQDFGPQIKQTPEIRATYNPNERLAITIAHDWAGRFNRNFGVGSISGEKLDWENEHLQSFALNLGRTVQGILHQDGEYGKDAIAYMAQTNDSFDGLINWANNLHFSRMAPRVQ
jgi:hypothetical protein